MGSGGGECVTEVEHVVGRKGEMRYECWKMVSAYKTCKNFIHANISRMVIMTSCYKNSPVIHLSLLKCSLLSL